MYPWVIMMSMGLSPETQFKCVRCKRSVVRNRDKYDVFERMHWSCFHYEYEHEGDPDIACADPTCPARAFDPNPRPNWFDERKGSGPTAP